MMSRNGNDVGAHGERSSFSIISPGSYGPVASVSFELSRQQLLRLSWVCWLHRPGSREFVEHGCTWRHVSRYGAYCGRALRACRTRLALSHRRRRARCADWAKGEWRRATAPRLSITIGETYLVPSFLQRPAYSPFNLCCLVFPLPRARPVHSVSASSVTPLAILIPLAVPPSQTLRPLPTSLRPQDAAFPRVRTRALSGVRK